MSFDFVTQTTGKWILCGEHAVLRQHPAIVFPLTSKTLTLKYQASQENFHLEFQGEFGDDAHLLFMGVLEHGFELIEHSISELTGQFEVNNTIPVGVGLGASASLAIALAHWFVWKQYIQETELYDFAKRLEHMFHGESSGLDIAGVMHNHPVQFNQAQGFLPFEPTWTPHWYLSPTGQIGITSHCVKKVKDLWISDPQFAQNIDDNMRQSVQLAMQALQQRPSKQALDKLASGINLAGQCFKDWGLANGEIDILMQQLRNAGALASKPTGSGQGGYVLSLWETPLTEPIDGIEFIKLA